MVKFFVIWNTIQIKVNTCFNYILFFSAKNKKRLRTATAVHFSHILYIYTF